MSHAHVTSNMSYMPNSWGRKESDMTERLN